MISKEHNWADIKINICGREIDCKGLQYEPNTEKPPVIPVAHFCIIEMELTESIPPVLINSDLENYNNEFELYLRRNGKIYLRNQYGFKLVFPDNTPFLKDLPMRSVLKMDFK